MENYVKAAGVSLRYHMKYHILAAALLFCLMPFLMGVEYLGARESARTLEMYAALSGILFLVPVFLPEQDKNIRDLIRSKRISIFYIYGIRILEALLFTAAFVGISVLFLKGNGCRFPMEKYFWGTWAEAFFLGSLGIFFGSMTDNTLVGYMVPFVYYLMNFGGDTYVKKLYLFSMTAGEYDQKLWLAGGGVLLIILGVLRKKVRP